jgi:hypothetical protein
MKRIFILLSIILTVVACSDDYTYNSDFALPTELSSPDNVALDVTSTEQVVLSWSGGGAADGSPLLYNVLFYAPDGTPVETLKSDLGAAPRLTLTHAQLNTLARTAGIRAMESGTLTWTVDASKAGVVKLSDIKKSITLQRGAGIDNIPQTLELQGTGAAGLNETPGRAFRKVADGVFQIYTNLADGEIYFTGDGYTFHLSNGKLTEGEGGSPVSATTGSNPARITVDFNSLSVTTNAITGVRAIYGANYATFGQMTYVGGGVFKALNCDIHFLQPGDIDWLSWVEERYYFIATVDGTELCWGRRDGVSAERPTGSEPASFYELVETPWTQWDHLWKLSGSLDNKRCDITIYTNRDGLMYHEFSNVRDIPTEIEHVPAELYLFGSGADGAGENGEGRAFRKVANGVFHLYTTLADGSLFFRSTTTLGEGYEYHANGAILSESNGAGAVTATAAPVRIVVDFNNKTVTTQTISDVRAIFGADYSVIATLAYAGDGVFQATDCPIRFLQPGNPSWLTWVEERYYFIATIDGTEKCWGRLDDVSAERPVGGETAHFYELGEFDWTQWDHLWKMSGDLDGKRCDITIYTNRDGLMYHAFSNIHE